MESTEGRLGLGLGLELGFGLGLVRVRVRIRVKIRVSYPQWIASNAHLSVNIVNKCPQLLLVICFR